MTYIISDGNARETASTLDAAIGIVEDWYDFMGDDERYEDVEVPTFPALASEINSVSELNAAIGEWERAIAEACGHKAFHGHGNYSVSAASEMGLRLRVEEADDE